MFNSKERLLEIFKKSDLSMSKFANILQKDRRTVTKWLDDREEKELDFESKKRICEFFRYPLEIWESEKDEFYSMLHKIKNDEIRIISEGYAEGLKYIFENESEGSLILHPAFPNPAYRDFIAPSVYHNFDNDEARFYRIKRGEKMRNYSFMASEWYSIKSLLEFCFSPLGNFYTREQKQAILDLMIQIFKDNLNKNLYFFDSYDKKIYGWDMFYLSINIKNNSLFFKVPLEMMLVEIKNATLVKKIHHYYTNAKHCPIHINPKESVMIMELLLECLNQNLSLQQSCIFLDEKTEYGKLFFKSLSVDL
ncbi:hypothetical protein OQH60_02115 [Campylobacter sp. MIT 21-1685]|uniref:hypothetical protein n=1 Tax=unclassified Campylobacter TaxID=2593542 RepID=UPI00224B340C|nr:MULTISPECIES: hypothetical protein [unclassified Campylobacter]MCX2682635.1 hypothetical protein [Campylobacter sp. MIT 21-1684]MCX2750915.1 hypothetical protein [Campylobacter sp. MIT 21-1682]MCX2807152.1 hypothetical protein [Campylobacter sp. MIT 21-1685]